MQKEVTISGFGGQGILFAGQLLAYAAMDQGKNVTWYPSYGPEMRGGTANCMVIVSDDEIGAALVGQPAAALVLNLPSLDKYEPLVKPGWAADHRQLAGGKTCPAHRYPRGLRACHQTGRRAGQPPHGQHGHAGRIAWQYRAFLAGCHGKNAFRAPAGTPPQAAAGQYEGAGSRGKVPTRTGGLIQP